MSECIWCGQQNPKEHEELKLCISELTHNWGLERNVFVKRIRQLVALNQQCRSSLQYNIDALSKADAKLIELNFEGREKS
jgi:hypothetical protein